MKIWAAIIVLFILFIGNMAKEAFGYPANNEQERAIEEVLDKVLLDKIYDIVWKRTFHHMSIFESIDEWGQSGTGTATADHLQLTIQTGATATDNMNVFKQPAIQGLVTFSQRSRFRIGVDFTDIANQTIYMNIGGDMSANAQGYGVKGVDASLYGVTNDGSTENAVLLQTITATSFTLEARYLPSDKVIFFVDGTEKGVSSANLPSPALVANTLLYYIKVTADDDNAKTVKTSAIEYFQTRNVLK